MRSFLRRFTPKRGDNFNQVNEKNPTRLNQLMTQMEEIKNLALGIQQQLTRLQQEVVEQGGDLWRMKQNLNEFLNQKAEKPEVQDIPYTGQLEALNEEIARLRQEMAIQQRQQIETEAHLTKLLQEIKGALKLKRGAMENKSEKNSAESTDSQQEKIDDSVVVRKVRALSGTGDSADDNGIPSKENLEETATPVGATQQKINAINQKAAQALLAQAKAVADAKNENWLAKAIEHCKRALETYADYNILVETAEFLKTYNQFTEALGLYQRALLLEIPTEQKALLHHKLAELLAVNPDQYELAKQHYQEALLLWRELAQGTPDTYLPNIATTLNNFANLLGKKTENYPLAKQYHEEALQIRRQLTKQTPAVYLPYVARSLNNLASLMAKNSNEQKWARPYYEEALQIRRLLAQETPGIHQLDLAQSLYNLANLLAKNPDDYPLAKQYHEEALQIRRQSTNQTPGAHLLSLAQSLYALANLSMTNPDEYELTKQYYQEALQTVRQLAQLTPAVYGPDVAFTLHTLANLLAKNPDDYSLAKPYYEEALQIRRQLAKQKPAVYLPDVARSLNSLAALLDKNPADREQAKDYRQEALQIERQLKPKISATEGTKLV